MNSLLARARKLDGLFKINEQILSEHLYTAGLPDPDLLIRTSGEMRVSNFLLWQIAYAEIFVTDKFWPDFCTNRLARSSSGLLQKRERRYGGLSDSTQAPEPDSHFSPPYGRSLWLSTAPNPPVMLQPATGPPLLSTHKWRPAGAVYQGRQGKSDLRCRSRRTCCCRT